MSPLGLSLGLGFSSTGGALYSLPTNVNEAGIYFAPADVGVGANTPSLTGGTSSSWATWLLIGGAAIAAWFLLRK